MQNLEGVATAAGATSFTSTASTTVGTTGGASSFSKSFSSSAASSSPPPSSSSYFRYARSHRIPAMLIQSIALVESERKAKSAIFSLLISACSTAMISTAMFYDKDTSPASRKESPDVYGAIPNTGRGLAFVAILAFSTVHILSKTLSTALLIVTNPSWFLFYMCGDIGFYFLQKILRRDFIYCKNPNLDQINLLNR